MNCVATFAVFVVLLVQGVAGAESVEAARLAEQGKAAYERGQFQEAFDLYSIRLHCPLLQ